MATRAALVDAAITSLREVGFAGASARDIARRAGSTQSQVFYHFRSVTDLLLAALDEVSARRMAVYQPLLDEVTTPLALAQLARTVIADDLASGDLRVLVEIVVAASTVPGLAAQVAQRLKPWHEFAESAVRKATAGSPFGALVPVREAGHAVVAGILGLELLESLGEGEGGTSAALLETVMRLAVLFSPVPGTR